MRYVLLQDTFVQAPYSRSKSSTDRGILDDLKVAQQKNLCYPIIILPGLHSSIIEPTSSTCSL